MCRSKQNNGQCCPQPAFQPSFQQQAPIFVLVPQQVQQPQYSAPQVYIAQPRQCC